MFFNAGLCSALSLLLVFTAQRIRGGSSYLDLFYPIALLGLGQAVNFLWAWQVQFYSSMLLAGIILSLLALQPRPSLKTLTAIGGCLLLLPLCGANGLVLVPAIAMWLAVVAVLAWYRRTGQSKQEASLAGAFALLAGLLAVAYLAGYHRVPFHPSNHKPLVVAKTAAQFLTMGFGPGIVHLGFQDRVPMPGWRIICSAILALYLLTMWMLWRVSRHQAVERIRAAGLLLFLTGTALLGTALGLGRDGFETRYVTFSVPGLCAIYLAWALYGRQRMGGVIQLLMLVTALIVLPANFEWGLRYGSDLHWRIGRFENDIRSGTPPYRLIERYSYLHPHHIILMDYMPMLRDAGIGAFTGLHSDPPMEELEVPLAPAKLHDVSWHNNVARATGTREAMIFRLPKEVNASGIRLRYTYRNPRSTEPYIAIYWKAADEANFGLESYTKYSPTGDRANWKRGTWCRIADPVSTIEAWTCHATQTIQVRPALADGELTIYELVVLIAEKPGDGPPPLASGSRLK